MLKMQHCLRQAIDDVIGINAAVRRGDRCNISQPNPLLIIGTGAIRTLHLDAALPHKNLGCMNS